MDLEEAQVFVEMTSKSLDEFNRSSRCIDGRYEGLKNFPMVAKPGADVGDVMVAFAALNILGKTLSSETVLSTVVRLVGGVQKFSMHTSDLTDPKDIGFGCEHMMYAKEDLDSYGVTQEQMDFLVGQLPTLLEQGAQQEVLHGDHAEQAVIVVDSESHGIMPLIRVGDNIREAFVYQKTLHAQQLDALGKLLQEALATQGDAVEDFQIRKALDDAFGKQLAETLKRLAPGLPVYTAMIDPEGSISIASF